MSDLISRQVSFSQRHENDCISRAEAIDILDVGAEFLRRVLDNTDVVNIEREKYEWALGLIESYIAEMKELPPSQPEQRWIPWESGVFPKESGTYTVTAYDGVTKRVTYAKYQKRLKRWELTGARAYWRVLAWMPLPEPYRKEGEAE